jgi:hypothetical protein
MSTNKNMNRNITRKCTTRPPGGPKRKRVTSTHRFDDTETASAEVNPAPMQLNPDAPFNKESTTDQLSALHVLEMLAAKMEDAALPRQARALETLLRKERVAMTVQVTEKKLEDLRVRALEWCLDDAKKHPEVADMFRHAFAALEKAQQES